jgi:hypothetical protein
MIVVAVYFGMVNSAFGEYGLSWNFILSSALSCPPIIGTIYGIHIMRAIYMQFYGMIVPAPLQGR